MNEPTTYRQAIGRALADELAADERVVVLGEDVGAAGGAFKVTDGLQERFGRDRVLDTPISEQAILGTAIGASSRGMRPVAEIMFADFAAVAYDQIVNQMAKYRYMTAGQVVLPLTVRLANGGGGGFGAQHSQAVENWFLAFPGLKVVVPGTPADAYALLRAAVRDPDPVLFFEHKGLYNVRGTVDATAPIGTLGQAEVVRAGEHVTLVATQLMRHRALEAAEQLAAEGVSAEVIDLRTLVPLDLATVEASVQRTNRLVVAQEASPRGSWGGDLLGLIARRCFDALDAAPELVAAPESPIPAGFLEDHWVPTADDIVAGVRTALA